MEATRADLITSDVQFRNLFTTPLNVMKQAENLGVLARLVFVLF